MTYTMVKKTIFRYPTERYLNVVGYKDDLDKDYLKINEKNDVFKTNNIFEFLFQSLMNSILDLTKCKEEIYSKVENNIFISGEFF